MFVARAASVFLLGFVSSVCQAALAGSDWQPVESKRVDINLKVTGRIISGEGGMKIESAGFAGRVVNILVKEGDHIRAGTPLLEVAGTECISLAEEQRVASMHQLSDMVQAAKGRAEQLHVRLRESKAGQDCLLISAHAGTLLKRNVEIGAAFNIGDSLITLVDTNQLSAEFDVNERDLGSVRIGQHVRFQIVGDSGSPVESKITGIIPSIDVVTRVARVRVGSVHFALPSLDAQLVGEILIPMNREAAQESNAFAVSPQSVVFAHNRRFVITGSNEKPVAAEVQVLSEDSDRAYVQPLHRDQLKPGDKVATSKAMYLLKRALAESAD